MHARDASGRRVSLLNDESTSQSHSYAHYQLSYRPAPQSYHHSSARSISSSPNTPGLLRSDSYDSQMSNEPVSPLTPVYDYARTYGNTPVITDSRYDDYTDPAQVYAGVKRPGDFGDSRSGSYEDEVNSGTAERSAKRYPCRFRETHGCEKTFTTSGHASRHSKIHTAEKAVQCTFPGCAKKFTRADNMKQHLDTHYKEKSRASTRPSMSSSERRTSTSGKSSSGRVKSTAATTPMLAPIDPWDMSGLGLPLSRPGASRTLSSGLDTLAYVCQEVKNS
ncbi:hypothetical protein OQA88_11734 [Cercophora sp. LCS_1]